MKYKERKVVKTDRKVSDVATGWYSKDAMSKILKWSSTLLCNSCTIPQQVGHPEIAIPFVDIPYSSLGLAQEEDQWSHQML